LNPPTYRIRDWQKSFEGLTFEMKRPNGALKWVAIPTKHDGKSYRRLMRLPNAAAIYGAWVLIVAVAGKCPERGTLADTEGPLTADDLEDKTGLPAAAFTEAIQVLLSERFMWLEIANRREPSRVVADCRENASTIHHTTPQDITIQDTTPRDATDGDGVSQKGFRLWKNATRQQILSPSGAQRVFQHATGAGICTTDERHHIFRLILSLTDATGNLPAILTSILRGDAGKDPWRARGADFDQQAKEWMRSLDVPPEMLQRTSDLSTGPPNESKRDQQKRLLEFQAQRKKET
jgi:hypothetical protein